MEAVHEDRRLRVAARHQERGQKVTPTSRTAASSSKAAGRMRRRGTESMMTLHPHAPVPGTQLGWSVTCLTHACSHAHASANAVDVETREQARG